MLRLAFLVASVAAVTISKAGNPDVSRKAFEDGRVAAAKTVAAQNAFEAKKAKEHAAYTAKAAKECQAQKEHVALHRNAQLANGNAYPPLKTYDSKVPAEKHWRWANGMKLSVFII